MGDETQRLLPSLAGVGLGVVERVFGGNVNVEDLGDVALGSYGSHAGDGAAGRVTTTTEGFGIAGVPEEVQASRLLIYVRTRR